MTERTLRLIKPDGVERHLVGEILGRDRAQGPDDRRAGIAERQRRAGPQHYAEHDGKPFFGSLLEFITSARWSRPIIEGPRAVAAFRQLAGGTDPVEKAAPGTSAVISALETQYNLVHGSDSPESAEREIALWFPNA